MTDVSGEDAVPIDATGTIEGVRVVPLRRIPDERGTIYHMLRRTDRHFEQFGEIYFTSIYRDVVKGWHRHRDMTLNYACIWGRIKLALYDERPGSPTEGSVQEQFMGPDDYSLVIIPPGIWTGFKGMDDVSLVANCATHPHDPVRTDRRDPFASGFPYDWGIRHR
ncbi:MAG: dTDP-4-dehydrorhamnose 3,5-epimerase family protein [Chloroflexi bacterium]|nr:dTDP-4-dehydrorhamnose 3,5-epimerase family protein [Chloroflexota bacterium]